MELIPAIDILGGKCVRLTKGDYATAQVYADDPAEQACQFADQGAKRIHVVDLEGARTGEFHEVEAIATIVQTGLAVQAGGGIRSVVDARRLLDFGADRVVMGSALADESLAAEVLEEVGDALVAAIDCRQGEAQLEGWIEGSGIPGVELAKRLVSQGAARLLVTDIDTDGTLQGPGMELLMAMKEAGVPIIASGGVADLSDLEALDAQGFEAAIVGRAIYEKRFTVAEGLAAAGSAS